MAKLLSGTRVYGNATVDTFLTVAGNIAAGNIAVDSISANSLVGITTTSVPEGNKLYYTNARVESYVNPKLTTANTIESSNNLYYTNARVSSFVVPQLTTANVVESASNLYFTNARVDSRVDPKLTTANTVELTNLYYTNARVESYVNPKLTTANTIESANNLYYTNARVDARVIPQLTTANVVESPNQLYFTNARVLNGLTVSNVTVSNLISTGTVITNTLVVTSVAAGSSLASSADYTTGNISAISANIIATNTITTNEITSSIWNGIYTANVIESNSNLYYTNARVLAKLQESNVNVSGLIATGAISGDSLSITNAITASSADLNSATIDTLESTGITTGGITSNTWTGIYTANVIESNNNLYYTNARVLAKLVESNVTVANLISTGVLEGETLVVNDIAVYAGLAASSADLTTANINSIKVDSITSNVWNNLYTANVVESNNNLYYTNARVRSTLSGGTGVTYDNANGTIAIGQDVSTTANVSFGELHVTGPAHFYGNVTTYSANNLAVSDNMIYLNDGSTYTNPDLGIAGNYNDGTYKHTGFFRDASDGRYKVYDNYTPEPDANIFIDTEHASFRLANLQATAVFANLYGNVNGYVSSIDNFTTDNLTEGSRLYYTNARVDAHVVPQLTTANVVETDNLYYTNARVASYIQYNLDQKANVVDLTTANVAELDNLYFTNARVVGALIAGGNVSIESNGQINVAIDTSYKANVVDLTTSNVTERSDALYYTNARVAAFVTPNLDLKANVVDLTTSNVAEGTNLYFTNTRAVGSLIAGANIVIEANGMISAVTMNTDTLAELADLTTANVAELNNLYYTNARVHSNVIGLITPLESKANVALKANIVDLTTANIAELNNLYYTNARVSSFVVPQLTTSNVVELDNLYYTNTRVDSRVDPKLTTANVAELNNLYYTNARVNAFVAPQLTTSNVAERSDALYYTNARVDARVDPKLTTSNVIEGDNLYYTNVRVGSFINPYLTTANIIESASNLYYTDERAISAIVNTSLSNLSVSGNVVAGNVSAAVFYGDGSKLSGVTATGFSGNTDGVVEGLTNLYYTNSRVYSNVIGLFTPYATMTYVDGAVANLINSAPATLDTLYELANALGNDASFATTVTNSLATKAKTTDLTTSNVFELDNLYYTNARVHSNVIGLITPLESKVNVALKANIVDLTTANVAELNNLYYTNARVAAFVTPNLNLKANVVDLTTSNVAEGSQLYYTNSRVSSFVVPQLTTANVVESTNNLYYTNARVAAFVTPNLDLKANVVDLTTANVAESATALYYTNARVAAFVTPNLNLKANVVDLTTSNVAEGSRLYYTNARVRTNVIALLPTLAGSGIIIAANGQISAANVETAIYANAALLANLAGAANIVLTLENFTTADLNEGTNLYYTDERVYANVSPLLDLKANVVDLTTANVAESDTALYYTNARVDARVVPQLTTGNVVETVNLYYTNSRVYSNVIGLFTPYATMNYVDSAVANLISSAPATLDTLYELANALGNDASFATTVTNTLATKAKITDLTTSNVFELDNLYYTNARVHSNVIGLITPLESKVNVALKANIVDLTTANVAELNNLYYTNSRVAAFVTPNLALKANVVDLTTSNVAEGSQLYYTNARVAAFVTPNLNLKANVVDLTTANVAESATALYYTNARVAAFVTPNLNLKANVVDLTTSNVAERSDALYYTNARVAAFVTPNLALKANVVDLTTSNVAERSDALYYTNARVDSYVTTATLSSLTVSGNVNAGNVIAAVYYGDGSKLTGVTATGFSGNTDGVIEGLNLYYTNARVHSNVIGLITPLESKANVALKANIVDLTTANVAELTNLYYTNARVKSALSGGTGVSYDTTTGVIAIGQDVANTSTVTFANLFVTGQTVFYGNVTTYASNNLIVGDNMLYLNANAESGNPDIGFTAGYNDGTYHHTGFFRDATDGNYKVFDNYTPEPDANVFIDTAHASFRLANIQANVFVGKLAGDVTGNVNGFVSSISNFTTSNLVEGNNLYYTNARVSSFIQYNLDQKANVSDLTTANVAETTNLYYTNARVDAYITPSLNLKANVVDLTTANVAESATSLYYTNARVAAFVTPNLALKANVVDLTTSNVTERSDALYYTNARVAAFVTPNLDLKANVVDLTTSNVTEGSQLYYTNARVDAFVAPNLALKANVVDLTTANIAELTNLFYTNSRVAAFVTPNLDLKANVVDLTTSNVVEGSQLYYTNARVYSNVIGLFAPYETKVNVALKANVVDLTTANIAELDNLYYTNARVAAFVNPNLALKANVVDLTTANIAELTNLFYTNARVAAFVTPNLNLKANVVDLTTSNVAEGSQLYYTNARVYSNVIGLFAPYETKVNVALKANVVDLTTSNVAEGSQLYYTNARVAANVTQILVNYATLGYVDGAVANLINSAPATLDTLYELAAALGNDASFATTVTNSLATKAKSTDLTTSNVVELTNLYFTNARAIAAVTETTLSNLSVTGNVNAGNINAGYIYGDGSKLTGVSATGYTGNTDGIIEGTINLFYTNARVYSNVIGLFAPYETIANVALKANVVDLTTANVAELTNLYYTNARVDSYVTPMLTTSNVVEGDNLYFTNVRVGSFINPYLTTANVTEVDSLYYTNARVYSNVIGLFAPYETKTNVALKANVVDLTTSNVTEGSGLYYTNARVYSNVIALLPGLAGDNMHIAANGKISAVFNSNANITVSATSQEFISNGSQTVFTLNRSVANETNILLIVDGLVQTPATHYTVSGTTLTLSSAAANKSNVVVRYMSAVGTVAGSVNNGYAAISANTTAVVNRKYIVDTSTKVTITLPATPVLGDEVGIIDGTGSASTNEITIAGNGNKINGALSNMVVNTNRAAMTLVYYNAAQGWIKTVV